MRGLRHLRFYVVCAFALITGCGQSGPPKSKVSTRPSEPILEIQYKPRTMLNFYRVRVHSDGMIYEENLSRTNIISIPQSRINNLMKELEKLGFFDISSERIADEIAYADANWQGSDVGHSFLIVDYTTTSLRAVSAGKTNEILWPGLEQYCREYPSVKGLRTLQRCVDSVRSSLNIQNIDY